MECAKSYEYEMEERKSEIITGSVVTERELNQVVTINAPDEEKRGSEGEILRISRL